VKKLLLLLFIIPNLVIGGMGQKQMAEPVEGNLFEILGDTLSNGKDSIPDMLPKFHKKITDITGKTNGGFGVQFATTAPTGEPPNTRAIALLTKLERLNDGTFLIPFVLENERGMWYFRVDCDTEEVENLGTWKKNTVGELGNFSHQINLHYNTIFYSVLSFVCGSKIEQGPRIANIFLLHQIHAAGPYFTYDLNSIKKVDESNYILDLGQAGLWDGKVIDYKRSSVKQENVLQFNCAEKSFMSFMKNGSASPLRKSFLNNLDDNKDGIFIYAIENACEYIGLNPSKIAKANEGDIPAKISKKTTPKVSIDDAKKQCEDIGFKPKTVKFGKCVLDLNR